MTHSLRTAILASFVLCPALAGAQVFDEITTKDGSKIIGEIVSMTDGSLTVSTAFGGDIKIDWADVAEIKGAKPMKVVLADGTELTGTIGEVRDGAFLVTSESLREPVPVAPSAITGINPPVTRAVTYKGNLGVGVSISDGNTQDKSASIFGDFVARSARQRLTIRGAYNYGQNDGELSRRNGMGNIKYDFFITKRLYVFADAFFEHDTFQDLNLRTSLSAGPGYQFVDKGDFYQSWLSELQMYAEAGIAYFSEDFKDAEDERYVAARWAVKVDWPIIPDRLALFHNHQGYPSLERIEDFYIRTEQGVRFSLLKNFVATIQVNWRYDNTPSPGFERTDTLYLVTLGYNFDL